MFRVSIKAGNIIENVLKDVFFFVIQLNKTKIH